MIRTLYKVTLTITEPWAVGGVADATGVDAPVLVDPRTRTPHLPAASLVGALRDHLPEPMAVELLGPALSKPDVDSSGAELHVLGTTLSEVKVEPRTTTAIDPDRRVAKAGSLRTEHLVPATVANSTTVGWFIESPRPVNDEFVDELLRWRPIIGRRRSVGRGRARVSSVETVCLDLGKPEDLRWWLDQRHTWFGSGPVGRESESRTPPDTELEKVPHQQKWDFAVVDAIRVGTGRTETPDAERQAKAAELLRDADGQPVIPGTSWKGLFRGRAEHIAGMLGGVPGVDSLNLSEVIAGLFGSSHGETPQSRGVLRFLDSQLSIPRQSSGTGGTKKRDHVAIDRFTGGARDGALFSFKYVPPGAMSSLVIESERHLAPVEEWLLGWVRRDLHDGIIGVGGQSGRGYGTVAFTEAPEPGAQPWAENSAEQDPAGVQPLEGVTS